MKIAWGVKFKTVYMKQLNRREFIEKSLKGFASLALAKALAGVSLLSLNTGCVKDKGKVVFQPGTATSFPYLEVAGDNYKIGQVIGSYFKDNILGLLKGRKKWFGNLKDFVQGEGQEMYEGMLLSSRKYFPHLVHEIEGISSGSGIPFDDLFLLNIKAEVEAAMSFREHEAPGCSTIYLNEGKRKLIMHNEDGNEANYGGMFIVKATPPSGVTFVVMTYPGVIMGNGPAMNNAGITQSTNYIASLDWNIGIPRYILGRAILEAQSLEEALSLATHPHRAFAYNHNLGSVQEKKIVSVEVTPTDYEIYYPDGLFFHTNHLILESTKNLPQDTGYVESSSMLRYKVIEEEIGKIENQQSVSEAELVSILSSHRQSPYSPCRHPQGAIRGRTLGTAIMNIEDGYVKFYFGNPCESYQKKHNQIFKLDNSFFLQYSDKKVIS